MKAPSAVLIASIAVCVGASAPNVGAAEEAGFAQWRYFKRLQFDTSAGTEPIAAVFETQL